MMPFDDDADPGLRKQILAYHASSVMTDRERARFLGMPDGCRIRENAKIICIENLKCGKNVWIGEGALLDASGGLEIGDNSQIGLYCLVWTHTSVRQALSGETGFSRGKIDRKATRIGKNCFVGGPSVIYPGVTIGDGSIILPMSVILNDVPSGSVSNGGPLERIRILEKELEAQKRRIDELEHHSKYLNSAL